MTRLLSNNSLIRHGFIKMSVSGTRFSKYLTLAILICELVSLNS